MNSSEHIFIGFFAFLGYSYLIDNSANSAHLPWIYGLGVVVLGSIIPDIIEPATSWRHRSLFHSVGTLKVITILFGLTGLLTVATAFFSDFTVFYFASCFFLGYLFHLLADSITPIGLPH